MLLPQGGQKRFRRLGTEAARLVNRLPGQLEAPEFRQRHGLEEPHSSVVGVETGGVSESIERLIETPLAEQDIAERGVGSRFVGAGSERDSKMELRPGKIPFPSPYHAETEAGERLVGIDCHCIAVEQFGFLGPPALSGDRTELGEHLGIPGTEAGEIAVPVLRLAQAAGLPRSPRALQESRGGDVPLGHPKVDRILDAGQPGPRLAVSAPEHFPSAVPIAGGVPRLGERGKNGPRSRFRRKRPLEKRDRVPWFAAGQPESAESEKGQPRVGIDLQRSLQSGGGGGEVSELFADLAEQHPGWQIAGMLDQNCLQNGCRLPRSASSDRVGEEIAGRETPGSSGRELLRSFPVAGSGFGQQAMRLERLTIGEPGTRTRGAGGYLVGELGEQRTHLRLHRPAVRNGRRRRLERHEAEGKGSTEQEDGTPPPHRRTPLAAGGRHEPGRCGTKAVSVIGAITQRLSSERQDTSAGRIPGTPTAWR